MLFISTHNIQHLSIMRHSTTKKTAIARNGQVENFESLEETQEYIPVYFTENVMQTSRKLDSGLSVVFMLTI
jgi:hypothetical protein